MEDALGEERVQRFRTEAAKKPASQFHPAQANLKCKRKRPLIERISYSE